MTELAVRLPDIEQKQQPSLAEIAGQLVVFEEPPLEENAPEATIHAKKQRAAKDAEKKKNGAFYVTDEHIRRIAEDNARRSAQSDMRREPQLLDLLVLSARHAHVFDIDGEILPEQAIRTQLADSLTGHIAALRRSYTATGDLTKQKINTFERVQKQLTAKSGIRQ